jgi:hypothetical protein
MLKRLFSVFVGYRSERSVRRVDGCDAPSVSPPLLYSSPLDQDYWANSNLIS